MQNRILSGPATYELHSLGWKAFQQLCISILTEVLGQQIESFADSNDAGRDGAFYGIARDKTFPEGSYTVQCKFTAYPEKCRTISEYKDEFKKITRLVEKGKASSYILMTNARISASLAEKIEGKVKDCGVSHVFVYGFERICQYIRETPKLRILLPRVYGLGDLSQIIDERAYAQAEEILKSQGDRIAKFVVTDAYRKSANALLNHGLVLLLGDPAVGKSTIASMLAIGALDNWGCRPIAIYHPSDITKHWNPGESKQFFWIDDAFGATQLDVQKVYEWNSKLNSISTMVRKGAKFIFTSRTYIFHAAMSFLKRTELPIINNSQVIIKVEELSNGEKEQILYNHIKLGHQNSIFKTEIKQFLKYVASHEKFSPEIARRLGYPALTKSLHINKHGIECYITNPKDHLGSIFETFGADNTIALAAVFMRAGNLESPVQLSDSEKLNLERFGKSTMSLSNSLQHLKGSFLDLEYKDGKKYWRFNHPTIGEAFASFLVNNDEHLDTYISGSKTEQMFVEASCGNMNIEGIKLIIPESRYNIVIDKIAISLKKRKISRYQLVNFIARRCDDAFLKLLLESELDIFKFITIESDYSYSGSETLIYRLHSLGLLDDEIRLKIIEDISRVSIEEPDASFIDGRIKEIFSDDEYINLLNKFEYEVIIKIADIIEKYKYNHEKENDPEDEFYPLEKALRTYSANYNSDSYDKIILAANQKIKDVIEQIRLDSSEQDKDNDEVHDELAGRLQDADAIKSERSIFDDVDL